MMKSFWFKQWIGTMSRWGMEVEVPKIAKEVEKPWVTPCTKSLSQLEVCLAWVDFLTGCEKYGEIKCVVPQATTFRINRIQRSGTSDKVLDRSKLKDSVAVSKDTISSE